MANIVKTNHLGLAPLLILLFGGHVRANVLRRLTGIGRQLVFWSYHVGTIFIQTSAIIRSPSFAQEFHRVGTCRKPSPILCLTSRSTRTQPCSTTVMLQTFGSRLGRLTLFVRLLVGVFSGNASTAGNNVQFSKAGPFHLSQIPRPEQGKLLAHFSAATSGPTFRGPSHVSAVVIRCLWSYHEARSSPIPTAIIFLPRSRK